MLAILGAVGGGIVLARAQGSGDGGSSKPNESSSTALASEEGEDSADRGESPDEPPVSDPDDSAAGVVLEPSPTAVAAATPAVVATSRSIPTAVPPTPPTEREAVLYGDPVNVRVAPNLSARVILQTDEQRFQKIDVLTEVVDGWYEVRIAGDGRLVNGWIFGAFVLPPSAGYLVAETPDRSTLELVNHAGFRTGALNPTNDVVLVVDTSNRYWEVILPDGDQAFIVPQEVQVVR